MYVSQFIDRKNKVIIVCYSNESYMLLMYFR